jgi:hypothetical protein
MEKYNIISLGYVCNVFGHLQSNKTLKKHLIHSVFDRIATPMWAIHDLLQNDFADFLLEENIKHEQLFDQSDRKEWYDSKYYIRFLNTATHEQISHIFQKKINKLKEILTSGNNSKPILFIRCEEKHNYPKRGSRIMKDEYAEKYKKSELEYLTLLSHTLKSKYPDLDFKILFMGQSSQQSVDSDNNIICIGYPESDFNQRDGPRAIGRLLKENSTFIENNL